MSKPLTIILIDQDDQMCGQVQVVDMQRHKDQPYERRSIISNGRKFMEPHAENLDVIPADEWREVPR